ncbi:MAG: TolC family protein [Saprospiraceae bacterium]|nr:TolC family protein [Saprospiraceae bacterium]
MSISLHQGIGQEVWSLEKCVQHALDNSLAIKQSVLSFDEAHINKRMADQGRLPTVDGSTSYNLSFGRRVDPTTNDFINRSFGNQGFSVSTGVVLFNGGRISNQIRRADLGKQAAELDVEQMRNDLSLDVALAYIQILFAQENLTNAQKSYDLIQSQLEQIDRLIEVGSRPKNARLDLVAQSAQNEQMVVAAENNIDIAYLALKQLLQLDDSYQMTIEIPDLPIPADYDVEAANTGDVYGKALAWQPSIRAGELRKQNAEIGVALARTNMIPSLSMGGSIGSNWSSSARDQTEVGTQLVGQDAFVNGEPISIQFEAPVFDVTKVNYPDQINQNLGYGFGVSLQVPIYNQGRSKANLDLAKLDVVRSDIANEQVKNQLKTDVQRSIADAKAAKKQYEAALRTAEATRAAFQDTEKRYNLGVANNFEFISAQNNRDQAEVDLIIAKYDYIFRSKVLDYYQGKRITLN